MDYRESAKQVIQNIGGKENLISAAHCATRLRLVIADNDKCNKEAVENIDGVKGVFFASGQLQIIFGTGTVNKVYDEFIQIADIDASSKDEVKKAAAAKQNIFKRGIKTLGDVFVPIIPAIVASGLLMGLLEGLSNAIPGLSESGTYTIIHLFSNAAFVFLPILVAISAARVFGGNIFLGAVIGMIMIHSDLLSAWSVATAETVPTASVWFGLYNINLVGYQGHVIPVVIAVWFMSTLEKKLHKIVPEIIDLFVTPFVTVLVTGYLTLTIFGPIFSWLETSVLTGVEWLITLPLGIGAFIVGGVYAPTVVAGVHHMYNVIEAGMLGRSDLNTWMPIATAANVAQGAAALALALKTKNKKLKSMALPASLSAFLGITEPAIFGVNLRFFKCFLAGCIGGAVGALFAAITHIGASAYGVTGVFGFLITTDYAFQYLILMVISAVIAFAISWVLYKDEVPAVASNNDKVAQSNTENSNNTAIPSTTDSADDKKAYMIQSPLAGNAIAIKDVKDEMFAAEVLGKGLGIEPVEGKVVSPCNGTITTIFDTKHAVGLTSDDGVEILIHIGLNTVELNGKYFTSHVTDGQKVKVGDALIDFDMENIKKAGYDVTTPVIIANTDNYETINVIKTGKVAFGDGILSVK